ncbi:hypothetical protein ACFSSC_07695 [Corynebacterium mendelii]|uniref:Uncharacterized protein n=1 Tax=Corynebacterium mendelii TaxID=2765362 RepID=A0A939IY59_9CORY|nr:hypothetical protein [Corynebacterium mendelii]MBN9644783.1 hypothetical protein [Corynebacterium mendelii]
MTTFIRLTAAATVAALALSACTPPGEVPSDKKVRTATEIPAPADK